MRTAFLLPLLLSGAAHAQDDLDKLLKEIPQIDNPAPAEAEANEKKPETSLDSDLGQVPLDVYISSVQAHLLARLKLSKSMKKKHATTTISLRLKISSSGKVTGMSALTLSGDKRLDARVIETVRAAAPLPSPPIVHRADALRGVVIDLPLAESAE